MGIEIVLSGAPPMKMNYAFGGKPSIEVVTGSTRAGMEKLPFADVFSGFRMPGELDRQSFEFPSPGSSIVQSIDTGRGDDVVALWARLVAPELPKMFGFLAPYVPADDKLVITAFPPKSFVGSFLHLKHAAAAPCMVFCANGSQSQTCITCEDGDASVRICC